MMPKASFWVVMMSGLSDHTRLINAIICLTRKNTDLPSPLFEKGYQLECIGLSFTNLMGNTINPDLSIKGDSDKVLLLVDCKSGGLEQDQAQRYASLSPADIVSQNVTTLDSVGLQLEIMFVGSGKNEKKLLDGENKTKCAIPVVILKNTMVLVMQGPNHFKNGILNEIFGKGIQFNHAIPTGFYPFSADDSPSYILTEISPILLQMHLKESEFSEDEILRESHQYYDYLDKKERDALRARIGFILNAIKKDQDFRFVFDRQKKWKIDPQFSIITLKKAIQEFVVKLERVEEGSKLKVTTLTDIFRGSQSSGEQASEG
jgi:hypothetical protein